MWVTVAQSIGVAVVCFVLGHMVGYLQERRANKRRWEEFKEGMRDEPLAKDDPCTDHPRANVCNKTSASRWRS